MNNETNFLVLQIMHQCKYIPLFLVTVYCRTF